MTRSNAIGARSGSTKAEALSLPRLAVSSSSSTSTSTPSLSWNRGASIWGGGGGGRLTLTLLGLYDQHSVGDKGRYEEEEVFGTKIGAVTLYVAGEKVTSPLNKLQVTAPLSVLYPATAYLVVNLEQQEDGNDNTHHAPESSSSSSSSLVMMTACTFSDHSVLVDRARTVSLPLQSLNDTSADDDDDDDSGERVLRLQILLEGPYRPEISKLLSISEGWFDLVDGWTDAALERCGNLSGWVVGWSPTTKMCVAAAGGLVVLPLVVLSVVLSPLVVGTALLFLPLLLPVLVVASFGFFAALTAAATWYLSSRHGRHLLGEVFWKPLLSPVLMGTRTGQQLVYETGPRPSLVVLCRTLVVPNGRWWRLVWSLAMDFVGSLSYIVPLAGEITDLGWAPLYFVLLVAFYGTKGETLGNASLWKYAALLEEVLPFTDFVPSATLAWTFAEWFGSGDGGSSNAQEEEEEEEQNKTGRDLFFQQGSLLPVDVGALSLVEDTALSSLSFTTLAMPAATTTAHDNNTTTTNNNNNNDNNNNNNKLHPMMEIANAPTMTANDGNNNHTNGDIATTAPATTANESNNSKNHTREVISTANMTPPNDNKSEIATATATSTMEKVCVEEKAEYKFPSQQPK